MFHFFGNDNHAYLSTFAADVGHTVLYGSLLSGGTLHILSDEIASDPIQLEKYFNSNRIDFLKIVPSHLKSLFGDSPEKILPHKNILIGGEELRWNWVCHITSVNKCNVFNHYGPTETAVGTFIYKVTDKQTTKRAAPIGKPMSNTKAYILDAHQQPLPPGFIGELYIGGSSVGRGYLNNAESTNEKYISNPFIDTNEKMYRTGDRVRYLSNGNIEFIERVDHQVKIRGFRVEIGEIERAIETYMAVGEAVVLANENESGSNELYAYIVPVAPLEPFNINDLRNFLINKLPEYMIPTHFTTLDEFPLTINGKVDRKKISKLGNDDNNLNNNYVPPSTIIEQQLARIWEEVLGAEKLGIHDDFFQLGGHSLSAIQTITRLKNIFEIEISIRKIFEAPTIKQLSIVIEDLLVEAIEL
ncbi:non-ribosomal peptide synthetase [Bacillus cereus group sp. TH152-1LC]|uniref:non-ribosomal peptide synthetase n=1 Tax=Bacillus cereus group sp. TH152-1LC TaxID=3018060 RepID=UPI0022E4C1AF|nr:non-ribosomal peptide synthetase [Bacillus cereus group sp. TH152-1LC]MDA1677503.1 non-ribosomal peptide synthetase [Bacillus cereus group sp. TH152-1LC]